MEKNLPKAYAGRRPLCMPARSALSMIGGMRMSHFHTRPNDGVSRMPIRRTRLFCLVDKTEKISGPRMPRRLFCPKVYARAKIANRAGFFVLP